jgi:hypothetical protein
MQKAGLIDTFQNGFHLALLPTLCIFSRSFAFAEDILPELSWLLASFPPLSRSWDVFSQWLALIVLSTAVSAALVYLVGLLPESPQGLFSIHTLWRAESAYFGRIPFDLAGGSLIVLALISSLTVFAVCLVLTLAGQMTLSLKVIRLPKSRAAEALVSMPIIIILCGLAIGYFAQIRPLHGAIVLAVAATLCMFYTLNSEAHDLAVALTARFTRKT